MRGEKRAERLRQEFGQGVSVGQHPYLAGEPAAVSAEVFVQALGLVEYAARMLQQRAAGLRRHHALASARQQLNAESIFHAPDAGRGGGEREMRAFGAAGDAAGIGDVTEKT
jgi:hypothetical protein